MVNAAGQQTLASRKRRGPAPTGKGTPVTVRLQPDQLAALDAWIAQQGPAPTRPEAIRLILQERLNGLSAAINALLLVHPASAWIDPLLEESCLPKEHYPSKKARLTVHEQW